MKSSHKYFLVFLMLVSMFSVGSEVRFIRNSFKGNTLTTTNDTAGANSPDYEVDFDDHDNRIGPNGTISFNFHF